MLVAACCLWVVRVEGLHLIALWNLLPLAWAGLAMWRGSDAGRPSWSAVAFAGLTTFAVALTHGAWVFDWGGTRTGSSTAGLVFLFSPLYSILLGVCGWAVVKVGARLTGR